MRNLVVSIGLVLALTATAYAQNPSNPGNQNIPGNTHANPQGSPPSNNQNAGTNTQSIQRQVRSNLEQAGFTDIKIMPESFLVRAKDKSGNTVMMVMNPDSVTAVEIDSGKSGSTTTGSASGRGTSGQPSGNSPGQGQQNQPGGPHR